MTIDGTGTDQLHEPDPLEPANPADSAGAGTTDGAERLAARARRREMAASTATMVAFAVVFVVYGLWLGGDFLDVSRRMFDISRSTPQLMLSIGVVVCMASHHFDLSVASMATLSAFLTIGLHIRQDWPMPLAIAAAVGVGLLGGLVNGLLVTRLRLSAFIATLGTGGVFAGLTVVYSKGNVIGPSPAVGTLPKWFSGPGSMGDFQEKVPLVVGIVVVALAAGAVIVSVLQRFSVSTAQRSALAAGGVGIVVLAVASGVIDEMSWTIVVLVAIAIVVWTYLTYTAPGRATYAIGGNPRAAAFAGVKTDRTILAGFIASGVTAALAGVVLAAIQGSAVPGIADPLLLPAYSAVFLSTVLMSRGRFHVWGTVIGGIFLVYVSSGLVAGGVDFTWTQVINGVVLVTTVSLSTIIRRK